MDGGQGRSRTTKGAAPLTLAALDRQLGLRRAGRADGARNEPPADASDWSAAEQSILVALAAERARIDDARTAARAEAERRLRAGAPAPRDHAGPARDARLALRQLEGRVSHDWRAAARRAAAAQRDLVAFKDRHDLHRAAHYPGSPLLQAGLLLCAAVFEALFSASLFAETDERGLLGGAVTAVGLSGANVTLGFLAGYIGLRYMQHLRWLLKSAGGAAFAAFGALALMLNLFAADWRDALAALAGDLPPTTADATLQLWSVLQLDSPQAIILLMLGAGVWVFAALKGYSGFDDPYPEFGKMDRAARDAAEDFAELRAAALAELDAPIAAARAEVAARLGEQRAAFDAMSKVYDEAAAEVQALDEAGVRLDALANAALALYRDENRAARSEPAPAYFDEPARLSAPAPDPLAGAGAMIDAARRVMADAEAAAGAALDQLVGELEAAAQRLDAPAP